MNAGRSCRRNTCCASPAKVQERLARPYNLQQAQQRFDAHHAPYLKDGSVKPEQVAQVRRLLGTKAEFATAQLRKHGYVVVDGSKVTMRDMAFRTNQVTWWAENGRIAKLAIG